MQPLDETDPEILRFPGEDARRPFSSIGEAVGLSGPAVFDRVTRLEEAGVINRFTVDADRRRSGPAPVFVRTAAPPGAVADLRAQAGADEAVEHLFATADGDIRFYARARSRTFPGGPIDCSTAPTTVSTR